jgi:adenylate cyclase
MRAAAQARPTEVAAETGPATSAPAAVPVMSNGRLLGVMFVDGANADAAQQQAWLDAMAARFGAAIGLMQSGVPANQPLPAQGAADAGPALQIRHYARDDSVFVDGRYLIKGVAGAILWKLLRDRTQQGRSEFCYRELRRDPSLRLPEVMDNLGARLILLQRRLEEQCPDLRIEKIARGLFRFTMLRPVELQAG